jgi:ABC-type phosphate transport system substrate-binding protein
MKLSNSKIALAVGAVVAASAAQQASALDISTYNEATQITLYISGATAVRPGLLKLFQLNAGNNPICADNTLDLYQSQDGLKYLALCTGAASLPAPLAGTRIAVHKTDQGGSGNGVAPVVRALLPAAMPDFWAVPTGGTGFTGCAGVTTSPPVGSTGFSTYVLHTACVNTPTQDRQPDAGISDLEPAIFRTAFSPALSSAELAAIPGNSISAVVFGIPVTLRARDNMQRILFPTTSPCHPSNAGYAAADETEACAPSLTKAQVAALYSGNYFDWFNVQGDAAGESVASPDGSGTFDLADNGEVFVCRRVSTSGTQATFETQLLGQRCVAGVPTFNTAALDAVHVNEGSGSSNVVACMTAANNANRGAIGTLSMEFNPDTSRTGTDSGFRFIKLNGVAPCLLPIVQSKYDFLGESTMQWRTTTVNGLPALSGAPLTLVQQVRNRIGSPSVVNDLNTAFNHPMCSALGTGALVGNALSNSATAPVPPFVVGGGGTGDVVARPILTKTRGVLGANSCGAIIDILPSQLQQ